MGQKYCAQGQVLGGLLSVFGSEYEYWLCHVSEIVQDFG